MPEHVWSQLVKIVVPILNSGSDVSTSKKNKSKLPFLRLQICYLGTLGMTGTS